MVCTIVLGPFTGYNLDRLALLIGWVAVVYDLREDFSALRGADNGEQSLFTHDE